eukprot:325551-Rhodomonas_salina.2
MLAGSATTTAGTAIRTRSAPQIGSLAAGRGGLPAGTSASEEEDEEEEEEEEEEGRRPSSSPLSMAGSGCFAW